MSLCSPSILLHPLFFFWLQTSQSCLYLLHICSQFLFSLALTPITLSLKRSTKTTLVKVTDDLHPAKSIRYVFYFIYLEAKKTEKEWAVKGKIGECGVLEAKRRQYFKKESLIPSLLISVHLLVLQKLKWPRALSLTFFCIYTHSVGYLIMPPGFNTFYMPMTPTFLSSIQAPLLNSTLDYPPIYSSSPLKYLTGMSNSTY